MQQVYWLPANDAQYNAVLCMNLHALTQKCDRIKAPNRPKIQKTLLIYVADEQAYFVAVCRQHYTWLSVCMKRGNHIAMDIRTHLVGIAAYFFSNDLLHRLLKTRWSGTGNQFAQKCYS